MYDCKSIKVLGLKGIHLQRESLPFLESLAVYNENLEQLDVSNNKLYSLGNFFKSLSRNWLSKLSTLNLANNQLTHADLKDFLDIFEMGTRAFERLLMVLRVLNVEGNPFTKLNPKLQLETVEELLEKFYSVPRKTLILI